MRKIVIGITPDFQKKENSEYYMYFINEPYIRMIIGHGGIPVVLPYMAEEAGTYIRMIDGLLVTGSGSHINPREYGEEPAEGLEIMNQGRFELERGLILGASRAGIPVLGICGGMQMMNVVYGGTLIQSLGTAHMQKEPPSVPVHRVRLEKPARLHELAGLDTIVTNSRHSQAVKDVAPGFRVSAISDDGVIEGIESDNGLFMMGLQWHPELLAEDTTTRLVFEGFMREVSRISQTRG